MSLFTFLIGKVVVNAIGLLLKIKYLNVIYAANILLCIWMDAQNGTLQDDKWLTFLMLAASAMISSTTQYNLHFAMLYLVYRIRFMDRIGILYPWGFFSLFIVPMIASLMTSVAGVYSSSLEHVSHPNKLHISNGIGVIITSLLMLAFRSL